MKNNLLFISLLFSLCASFGLRAQNGNALNVGAIPANKIPQANVDPILQGTSWTIEFWVKLGSTPATPGGTKLLGNHATGNKGISFEFPANSNKLNFVIGKATAPASWVTITGATAWTVGEWNHVAVTATSGGTIKYYLNGALEGTGSSSTGTMPFQAYTPALKDLGLGYSVNYNAPVINTEFDELRLWKTALIAADITKTMYTPLVGNETSLAFYYDFNSSSGSPAVVTGVSTTTPSYAYNMPIGTSASLVDATSPVANIPTLNRDLVVGNWSKKSASGVSNSGLSLPGVSSASYTSNVIVGKRTDATITAVSNFANVFYMQGGWVLAPKNLSSSNVTINLVTALGASQATTVAASAQSYYLLKQDSLNNFSIVNSGSYDGTNITFNNTTLDGSVYYLGWNNAASSFNLNYALSNVFTKDTAIANLNPTVTGTADGYSITPNLPAGLSFDTATGVISGTPTALSPMATYTVTATNSGGSILSNFSITINDIAPSNLNYSSPNAFTKNTAISSLNPTNTGGTVVSYNVMPSLPAGLSLNTTTGVISGTPTVLLASGTYTVTATNSGGSTSIGVIITVNDIAPSSLSYTSPNVFSKNSVITSLSPTVAGGAVVSYNITPNLPAGLSLNTTTGVITGTPIAVSAMATYTVTATNTGGNAIFGVVITVNDIAPNSLSYTASNGFTKNSAISSLNPMVAGGLVVSYSVTPSLPAGLSLDAATGVISGTPTGVSSMTTYAVTATNTGGSTSFDLAITVNDIAPSNLSYTASNVFSKNSSISSLNPTVTGGTVTSYSVSPILPDGLSLDNSTGVISGTPTAISEMTTYTVAATNTGGITSFDLTITVNDIAPSNLSYTASNVFSKNSSISSLNPTVTGGTVTSYSVSPTLPDGLSLDNATGVISGTPTAISEMTTYTVAATNTGGITSFDLTITVNDIAPSNLSYTASNVFSKNSSISSLNPTVTGGTVTSYSVSPTLPDGLSLDNATGVISGTPTAISEMTTYTVAATNTGGITSFDLTITVNDIAPSNLSYTASNVFTKNLAISNLNPTVGGGTAVSYSITPNLPAGLSFDTATGIISGTPTSITPMATYTVTATNTGGSTSFDLVITVNESALSNLSYTSSNVFTKDTAISNLNPTVATGTAVSYSITQNLPAGLYFDVVTGVISGTPTAISPMTTYTVTASNSVGSTSFDLVITVNDIALSNLSYTSPNVFTKNTTISNLNPTVSGGTAVSYSITPNLPAGLTIDAVTGVISGTPTALSPMATYTVTALNSAGSTSFDLVITINDIALSNLSYTSPNVFTKDTAISNLNPTVATGTAVSYSITQNLPAGLSFDVVTGVISGTPTAISPMATYTVTASNSVGSTSFDLLITVNDIALSNLSYTSPNVFTKNTVISNLNPTVSGGTAVSYSITPILPAGLSIDGVTGIISGTPTAISPMATYTVTALNSAGSTSFDLAITVNDIALSNLSYTSPNVFTKNTTISNLHPTVSGGTAVSYSITPNLPAGLSIDAATGVISGTPTAILPMAAYTVTALNSAGSTSLDVAITVNDIQPSNLRYSSTNEFTKNRAIFDLHPEVDGGTVINYSIMPNLPAGLSFDNATGVISGTPTETSPIATYTVTALNSGGSTSFNLVLAVNDNADILGVDTFDIANFSYYPNPVKDVLNISLDKQISYVVVLNLLGQQVISKTVNVNQTTIDMSDLSKGTYLIKIISGNKTKTVKAIRE